MRRQKINGFLLELPRMLRFLPMYLFILPGFALVNRKRLWKATRAKCGPVRITSSEDDYENFAAVTLAALALIEKHDPKRYARLRQNLRFISDEPATAYAGYYHPFRECQIHWNHAAFDWAKGDVPARENPHYAWYLAGYATTLVHEATHGRLHALGFPYTKRTRVRCERICVAEERRFAARLPQDEYDFARDLIRPFDPAKWEAHWSMPRLQQFKEALRRVYAPKKTGKIRPCEKPLAPPLQPPLQSPPRKATGTPVLKPIPPKVPYSIWPKPSASDAPHGDLPAVEMPEWAAPLVRARPFRKSKKQP